MVPPRCMPVHGGSGDGKSHYGLGLSNKSAPSNYPDTFFFPGVRWYCIVCSSCDGGRFIKGGPIWGTDHRPGQHMIVYCLRFGNQKSKRLYSLFMSRVLTGMHLIHTPPPFSWFKFVQMFSHMISNSAVFPGWCPLIDHNSFSLFLGFGFIPPNLHLLQLERTVKL